MKPFHLSRVLLLWLCLFLVPLQADWQTAMTAFDDGDFETAYTTFLQLREADRTTAALEFNLGNSAFRMGRPDIALAHYRLAQWLSPNDPDLRENQQMAADLLATELPNLPTPRRISAFLPHKLWRGLWFTGLWLLAAYGLVFRTSPRLRPRLKDAAPWVIPLTIFLTIGLGTGVWASRITPALQEAVVLGEEVIARFEPHDNATTHYQLPGGSIVRIEAHTRQWTRILHGDRSGWIPRDQLHPLFSPPAP